MSDDYRLDEMLDMFTEERWEEISRDAFGVDIGSRDGDPGYLAICKVDSNNTDGDARLIVNAKRLLELVFEALPWCSGSYEPDVLPDSRCLNVPTFISEDEMGKTHVCAEHRDQVKPWSSSGWKPYKFGRHVKDVLDAIKDDEVEEESSG